LAGESYHARAAGRSGKLDQVRRGELWLALQDLRRLFTLDGYAGSSMEQVRRAAGVSNGGLYHHFLPGPISQLGYWLTAWRVPSKPC